MAGSELCIHSIPELHKIVIHSIANALYELNEKAMRVFL